jgi:hypothetical protein
MSIWLATACQAVTGGFGRKTLFSVHPEMANLFIRVCDKKTGGRRHGYGSVAPIGMNPEAGGIVIADIFETGRLQQRPGILGPKAFVKRKPFLNLCITAKEPQCRHGGFSKYTLDRFVGQEMGPFPGGIHPQTVRDH